MRNVVSAALGVLVLVMIADRVHSEDTFRPSKLIVDSRDDREASIPSQWWLYSNQPVEDIIATYRQLNARIADISVEQSTPTPKYTVAYISNTGTSSRAWSWFHSIDTVALTSYIASNNTRIISLKVVEAGQSEKVAAIMIPNTGADAKFWWWYVGLTREDISSKLAANNARLVQISAYETRAGTRYAVVMIGNIGVDAKNSWWYTNTPASEIPALVAANNARVLDLDYNPTTGNYNLILVSCAAGCPASTWYAGQSLSQLNAVTAQAGSRVIDINSYPGCSSRCYSFVTIDNSLTSLEGANAITSRVAKILRNDVGGVEGLFLKEVGGPILANLEEGFTFHPASAIKVLPHLYAIRQIQAGAKTLNDLVPRYTNGPAVCPDPPNQMGTETLRTALTEMMFRSDNSRTREVTDTFGIDSINRYAGSIGMNNTRINVVIGCAGAKLNQLTLMEAGLLYEGVASGTLLDTPNRALFHSLMAGYDLGDLVDQEAPATMTAGQKLAYRNQVKVAFKSGGSGFSAAEYYAVAGWARIPFCGRSGFREYVFGIFLHGATYPQTAPGETTAPARNFNAAHWELLREQIRAGLASCMNIPSIQSVVNGASFASPGVIVPGSFITIYGNGFGSKDQLTGFPATTFEGIIVTFNGIPAPLFHLIASRNQINLLVPSELPETGTVNVSVNNLADPSTSFLTTTFSARLVSAAPGIFRILDPLKASRKNAAALFPATAWVAMPFSMASALGIPEDCAASGVSVLSICGQPARTGDVLQLYVTGLGKATPNGSPSGTPLRTGNVAPADGNPVYRTVVNPVVTIGGLATEVLFAGLAPGYAGLYQINVRVPVGVVAGDDVPVVVSMPGSVTDTATIAISR